MKVKELILKKVPLYLNEKYYTIFIDILQNIQQNPKSFENSSIYKKFEINQTTKNKKILFPQDSLSSVSSIESSNKLPKKNYNTLSTFWSKIIKAIFNETEYNCIFHSELEICYLKYKAYMTYTKLKSLSYEIKRPLNILIDIYLNETQKIIDNIINQKLLDKQITELKKHKKELLDKKNDKDSVNKNLEMELNKKILLRKQSINTITKLLNEDSNKEKEKEKVRMLNLFFDKVDLEKYFQKEQIAEIKRGEFANAIINHNHCFTQQQHPNISKSVKRKIIKNDNNKNIKYNNNYTNINQKLLTFIKNKNDNRNKITSLKKMTFIKHKNYVLDSSNEKNNSNYLPKLKQGEFKDKTKFEKKLIYTTMHKTGKNFFHNRRNLFLNNTSYSKKSRKDDSKKGKSIYTCTNKTIINFMNKKYLYY